MVWSVDDLCQEMTDIASLIKGKPVNDTFVVSLCTGLRNKIGTLPSFCASHAVQLKKGGEVLPSELAAMVDKHIEKALSAVQEVTPHSVVAVKPQSLLHINHFLTKADWKELDDPNTTWIRKQCLVAFRLKKLGIASMAEQTVKSAVALLLTTLTSIPEHKLIWSMVQEFKATFASVKCDAPHSLMSSYPDLPGKLPQGVFQRAYADELPVSREVEQMGAIAKHIPLRRTSKLIAENVPNNKATQSTGTSTSQPLALVTEQVSAHTLGFGGNNPLMGLMNGFCQMLLNCHNQSQNNNPCADGNPNASKPTGSVPDAALNFKPTQKPALETASSGETLEGTQSGPKTRLPLADVQEEKIEEQKVAQDPKTASASLPSGEYEAAAFEALKNKKKAAAETKATAKAKAKAKAKTKAKAKAKQPASTKNVKKRPASAMSCSQKQHKPFGYVVPPPNAEQLKKRKENYCDKHYHKCIQLAMGNGFTKDEATIYGRIARADAVKLWSASS